jgi:hypothetical protein
MRDVGGWFVGCVVCCVVLAASGCGDSTEPSSDESTATTAVPSVALRDGSYALTGTQECKNPRGGDPIPSPIFDGSTLTIAGDRATVSLTSDPVDGSVTIDATSFRINGSHDGQWPVDLTGTSVDGGQTITGTGQDAGVNCTYSFTGRWGAEGSPTTPPSADPCSDMTAWADVDPAIGELRVISSCEVPWARANFANHDDTLLHWDGSAWKLADAADYCATVTRPPGTPDESSPALRIWIATCEATS